MTSNPKENASLAAFRSYMSSLQPGLVTADDLDRELAAVWDHFHGGTDTSMAAWKLIDRVEDAAWSPPILTFSIERHGGTVQGSSRADLHHWCVNIERCSAEILHTGHRQLKPMAKRLDVKPLAGDVAELILNKATDEKLKWVDDDTVQVKIGKVVPDTSVAQTVSGRRKRFRAMLTRLLAPHGWTPASSPHNTYVRCDSDAKG